MCGSSHIASVAKLSLSQLLEQEMEVADEDRRMLGDLETFGDDH
jgi:hypothetical protein